MAIDILSLDAVKESEQGFDLNVKNPDGSDSGVILIVLGKHAKQVTDWSKREFAKLQKEEEIAKRRKEEPKPKTIEELEEFSHQGALIRVIGWKNVKQEFTQELFSQVLKRNPHWIEQISAASEDAANFTKAA